jgi:hypothetical protein
MNGMRGFEAPQCCLPPDQCLRRSGTRGVGSSLEHIGLLDLAVPVTTGFLTSPSPLQMYSFDAPNELITA